jgi:hypothetical protein
LNIFPNPVRDNLYIHYNGGCIDRSSLYIEIFDIAGKKVFQSNNFDNSGNMISINVSKFNIGIYICKVNYKDYSGNSYYKYIKILKQ